ncbi:hypothetical protein DPMN_067517 [Dreissena polymorpha]|uniref:Uncharacterized protein n=1 Tax=Dreissena polymorpha TaxID=45954 RepID=A0A9D4BVW1_DREPO|nr:hypothetical protein DPMN_067517 [Dreissena polymorpha]
MVSRNRNRESKQPCLKPVLISKASVICLPLTILQVIPLYDFLMMLVIFPGTPFYHRSLKRDSRSTLSNAFS